MIKYVTTLEKSSLKQEKRDQRVLEPPVTTSVLDVNINVRKLLASTLTPMACLFFELGSPDLALTIVCQVLHEGSSRACVSFLSPPSIPKT